jgi:hypothetical protein
VDRHLVSQQEPSPQPGGLRAEGEHGRDSASVADPTRRDDRHRCHRVDHRRHQGERRHATPYVPARLPALRNDDVHSTCDCAAGFLGAADRVQNKPCGVMHHVDIALGTAPEERHDPQTGRKSLVDPTVLVRGENEVAAKRSIGQCCRFANHIAGVIGPPEPHGAERAGIRDRGGQPGVCSQRR